MRQYVLRRLILLFPVMFGVTLIVFFVQRLIPGDVVMVMLAESPFASQEKMDAMRALLGIDKPVHEQYISWIGGVVRGDLGMSFWTGKPVAAELARRIPVSMQLALMALTVSVSIALPIGVVSAVRQNSRTDYALRFLNIAALSMPGFWIATLIIVYGAVWFKWAPPLGYTSFQQDPWKNIQQLLLPAIAMGMQSSAVAMRMTRSQLLEVLRQDYVRTAWAKGLRERVIIYRHGLKNALIPVVTMIGNQFGFLLGGTVIMETIFNLPGVGRLTLDSIRMRDYAQVQGNVLFLAGVFVCVNLIVDLIYGWLDPRIRYH